jgi:phage protein D
MDDADFASVAEAWGKKAGVNVQVTGEMASIKREYWLQQHESFTAWGQRMARELGASFQVHGDRAFFADLNAGVSVTGQPLTDISAIWGENLLNWSLSPIQPRPKFKNLERRYFDVDKGEEVVEAAEEAAEGVEAVLRHHVPSAGKEHAQQSSAADAKASSRNSGGGSVSILGNEACQPEANCLVQGTRPGIDGTYRIDSVDHQISKGGFVTNLNLKEPKGGAGVDPR